MPTMRSATTSKPRHRTAARMGARVARLRQRRERSSTRADRRRRCRSRRTGDQRNRPRADVRAAAPTRSSLRTPLPIWSSRIAIPSPPTSSSSRATLDAVRPQELARLPKRTSTSPTRSGKPSSTSCAAENYLAAVEVYRAVDGPFTPLAIAPLTSLGDNYHEADDDVNAVAAYYGSAHRQPPRLRAAQRRADRAARPHVALAARSEPADRGRGSNRSKRCASSSAAIRRIPTPCSRPSISMPNGSASDCSSSSNAINTCGPCASFVQRTAIATSGR